MFGFINFIPQISTAIQSDRLTAIRRYNNQVDGLGGLLTIAIIIIAMVAVFLMLRWLMKLQKRQEQRRKKPREQQRNHKTAASRR
ncbi:hypothetical protein [Gynuella sunshinyii]|uniref:Putative membrane protein n=1 Tax=Gynuella sunshinyii YC6258 TaxID=1445510 RepID=A0A0C5VA14_9GAMM|nr:hypothetical protein [Gynuella sunshinyii]AJQ96190.1 putative membrane protein [Gynuella sunshinyii YC6258]